MHINIYNIILCMYECVCESARARARERERERERVCVCVSESVCVTAPVIKGQNDSIEVLTAAVLPHTPVLYTTTTLASI